MASLGHNVIITPARAAQSAARRACNNRVPILRARARQPRFGSSMQYCIRSLISITNVQKYCKRAKVRASLLLWHFQTIWIENVCLLFIEVHRSNQQKLFYFAHRGFSYFLISTQNFNEWRPNVGINILVLTNAKKECGVRKYGGLCWLKNIQHNISIFWWSHSWFWRVAQSFRFCRHELPSCHVFSLLVVSKYSLLLTTTITCQTFESSTQKVTITGTISYYLLAFCMGF